MNRALTPLATAVLGAAALTAALPATSPAATEPVPARGARPAVAIDPVIQWNRVLLAIQATPGAQPAGVHPTYELVLVHAAMFDAVAAIDPSATPFLASVRVRRNASSAAAADAAARDTLVRLYPALRASIDQHYAAILGQVPDGLRRTRGVRVGRLVAARIAGLRAHDGATAPPVPLAPGSAPGAYRPTPPAPAAPAFTQWAHVMPFIVRRADRFRPAPPPALTSPAYAAALEETRLLGAAQGSTRTPDQTQIGLFWNGPIWAIWNQIAQTAAIAHHGGLLQTARAFAAMNLSFADATIALYDAKYTYARWRPITAIRAAATDGNPATTGDPTWTPLSPTAPDPSYPGAHATISAAGAAVLDRVYGDAARFAVTSAALPGVVRRFASFSGADREAFLSRIYNGNHTRADEAAGDALGRDVANAVIDGLVPGPARGR